MNGMIKLILEYLKIAPSNDKLLEMAKMILVTGVLALFIYVVIERFIMKIILNLVRRTKTQWDDYFINRGLLTNFSLLVPIIIFQTSLEKEALFPGFVEKTIKVFFIVIIIRIIQSVLNGLEDIYETFEIAKEKPVKSYIQIINIFIILTGAIIFVALIFNKSPLALLSGIGAMTAILLLVFKDALLGFVASIQLASNNLVSIGDWIEMPSQGADGQVVEINLTNVKVQNWDKTIITIPSYSLVSQSFKNWKGMEKSGGRRIKRTVNIDIGTVKFLSPEELMKFEESRYLKEYLEYKQETLKNFNENLISDLDKRKINNLSLFRIYLENYLKANKCIDENKPVVVRELQSTQFGLPLEIYCFANVISWAEYEKIQSDVIDYAISIAPYFHLAIFQVTSGNDTRRNK